MDNIAVKPLEAGPRTKQTWMCGLIFVVCCYESLCGLQPSGILNAVCRVSFGYDYDLLVMTGHTVPRVPAAAADAYYYYSPLAMAAFLACTRRRSSKISVCCCK